MRGSRAQQGQRRPIIDRFWLLIATRDMIQLQGPHYHRHCSTGDLPSLPLTRPTRRLPQPWSPPGSMTEASDREKQRNGASPPPPPLPSSATAPPPPPAVAPPTTAGLYASPADKPFLGGYRHAASGTVFHHAATQTPGGELVQPRRVMRQPVCAATQTGQPRSKAVQCPHDAASQCDATDTAGGKVLIPTGRGIRCCRRHAQHSAGTAACGLHSLPHEYTHLASIPQFCSALSVCCRRAGPPTACSRRNPAVVAGVARPACGRRGPGGAAPAGGLPGAAGRGGGRRCRGGAAARGAAAHAAAVASRLPHSL